ncbi:MAG TPA: hypothetical protein DC057_02405 [Spirochaetia bacterium]|nr:hypothetical protein [Spirochaetia bacterium]
MENKTLDKCGNNIVSGCYIVYGHNLGRCAGLKFGKVLKVEVNEDINFYSGKIEYYYKISVIGVDDDWNFQEPKLSKKGILQFPERIIVLPFEMLPEYAQNLLKDV